MPAKRIILMYISEISGHHSATIAIENALKKLSPNCEILNINAFNYTNPITEKIINRLYMSVIKMTPKIWDYLYDNPEVAKNISLIKESIHKFNSPKLKKLFESFNPDIVLCAQAFPCGMVADFKKTYNYNVSLVAVLTDYAPHSYWVYDTVDFYITPSQEVTQRLIQKGVPDEKIKTFGIPFEHKFNEPVEKEKIIHKLKLTSGAPTILIMGGGQGLGPIKTIIKSLEKTNLPAQEIVVTGTNKKLYRSLTRKAKKLKKKAVVLGYVNNISELMSISDIIITKPGGITTAEALAKNLPIIIVKPIPGQETNNTDFLTLKDAAIKVDDAKKINQVIEKLLLSPDSLNKLREASKAISKPNASMDIANFLLGL